MKNIQLENIFDDREVYLRLDEPLSSQLERYSSDDDKMKLIDLSSQIQKSKIKNNIDLIKLIFSISVKELNEIKTENVIPGRYTIQGTFIPPIPGKSYYVKTNKYILRLKNKQNIIAIEYDSNYGISMWFDEIKKLEGNLLPQYFLNYKKNFQIETIKNNYAVNKIKETLQLEYGIDCIDLLKLFNFLFNITELPPNYKQYEDFKNQTEESNFKMYLIKQHPKYSKYLKIRKKIAEIDDLIEKAMTNEDQYIDLRLFDQLE